MFVNGQGSAGRRVGVLIGVVTFIASTVLTVANPTSASSPGRNGGIVFERRSPAGNAEIYVMAADGTDQTQLTSSYPANDTRPSWSPDGTKIGFVSSRDGNPEIYVMNADGTNPVPLTSNSAYDGDPDWSPDGSKIVFTSRRDRNVDGTYDHEIYVMNADGTGQTALTDAPLDDQWPKWSPDGERIVFTSNRDGNREIYVMDAGGGGQTRLTHHPSSFGSHSYAGPAAWSPDATQLAFSSFRDGNFDVYVMNADGSAQTRLTEDATADLSPTWSPDGTQIAFASSREEGNSCSAINCWDIYVMNADGTDEMNLTNFARDDKWPDWGPSDGVIVDDGEFFYDTDGDCIGDTDTAAGAEALRHWHVGLPFVGPEAEIAGGFGCLGGPQSYEITLDDAATVSGRIRYTWDENVPGGCCNDVHLHVYDAAGDMVASTLLEQGPQPVVPMVAQPHERSFSFELEAGDYTLVEDVFSGEHTSWLTRIEISR